MNLRRRQLLRATAALAFAACTGNPVPTPPPLASAKPSPPEGRRVLVAGAGLAGMVVAKELLAKGYDVTVLEAQERAGGRILTIRAPFSDGLYMEAGATHVVPDPDLVALFDELGVALASPKRPKGLSRARLRGGVRTVMGSDFEDPPNPALSPEEQQMSFFARLERVFAIPEWRAPGDAPWPEDLLRYDRMSAGEYLRGHGASQGFVDWVGGAFMPGEDMEQSSALSIMSDASSIRREIDLGKGGGRVVGGSDKLPAALAARLGERILYGAVVKRIEHGAEGVRVYFERKGARDHLDADRLVCAIPYTVLRSIEVAPAFSEHKREAIAELRLASVVRMGVQSDSRFWNERGESGGADSDLPLGDVRDESELLPGSAGILGYYLTGDRARRVCALGADARIAAAVDEIDKVHAGMRDHFVTGASKCWDEDPYARGAYAFFTPGQLASWGPALAGPEGRVHFAGDHTSHRPGFMHGAVASARRAVAEILAAHAAAPT